jgi:hypothetical protein
METLHRSWQVVWLEDEAAPFFQFGPALHACLSCTALSGPCTALGGSCTALDGSCTALGGSCTALDGSPAAGSAGCKCAHQHQPVWDRRLKGGQHIHQIAAVVTAVTELPLPSAGSLLSLDALLMSRRRWQGEEQPYPLW